MYIPKPRFYYGWFVIVACWIMVFPNGATVMSVFFKPMLDSFGFDRPTLSSVQSVSFIFVTLAGPFLGRLLDRIKPRKMMFICLGTEVLGTLLNAVALNIWHLYLARMLSGITVVSATRILISNWFVKKRGRALHIAATGVPIGTMILVPVSQQLILAWGWRLTLLFWAGIIFAILLPFSLIIRNNPSDMDLHPDGDQSEDQEKVTSDSGLTDSNGLSNQMRRIGVSLSEALKTKSFWFLFANQFFCGIGCGFMATHIIIFATDMGYSAGLAASLVSVQSGMNLVGILGLGYLSEKITGRKALVITHFIRSTSFLTLLLFLSSGGKNLWMLYLAMLLFGQGAMAGAPLCAGLVVDSFGIVAMGAIVGATFSAHSIGSALGAYAAGDIYQMTKSYFLFFAGQGLLELGAGICAFFVRTVVAKPHSASIAHD